MSLEKQLLNAAIKGMTNQQSNEDAIRLLREAGKQSFQKLAGYLPAKTDAELPIPADSGKLGLINSKAVKYLSKLMEDKDYYFILPEWSVTAAKLSLSLPHEWIPALLKIGAQSDSYRPYIMLLMDSHAYFLVEHSSAELRWDWVLKQARLSLYQLEAFSEREGAEIMRGFEIAQERSDLNIGIMGMVRLSTIKPPWNVWLADSFMSFMRRSIYQGQLTSIFTSPFLERLAKYLPLEYAENFMVILDNGLESSKWWLGKRDTIQTIFEFRRTVIASLEESSEESYH